MKNSMFWSLILVTFIILTGCASIEHNTSTFTADSQGNKVLANAERKQWLFTVLMPTPAERATNMSKAYSGAAETNFRYQTPPRIHEPLSRTTQHSAYLPDNGEVVFSTSADNGSRRVLVQNNPHYAVRVLDGPFATAEPLMPNEQVESDVEIPSGTLKLPYEWTNLKTGQVGRKIIPRHIKPGQKVIYISETLVN